MAFAENVKKLREEKGMTQQGLTKKVDVAQSMVTQCERYIKIPNVLIGV